MVDEMPEDRERRLTPDPSERTVEALRRDIAALEKRVDATLQGMDRLADERHANIEKRFAGIEEIRKEQKADTERNVADALKAITKQIDLLTTNSTDNFSSIRRDIDALRGSLGAGPPL